MSKDNCDYFYKTIMRLKLNNKIKALNFELNNNNDCDTEYIKNIIKNKNKIKTSEKFQITLNIFKISSLETKIWLIYNYPFIFSYKKISDYMYYMIKK